MKISAATVGKLVFACLFAGLFGSVAQPVVAIDLETLRAMADTAPATEREAAARSVLDGDATQVDRGAEGEVRTILGQALVDQSRFEEALRELRLGLEIATASGSDDVRLDALGQIAIASFHLGDFANASEAADSGWELATDADRPERAWRFANTQAAIHLRKAEYTAALERYSAALDLQNRVGDPEIEAVLLNNISVAQMYIGDYPKALATLERARSIREEQEDPGALADVIANTGDVLHLMGDEERAIEQHEEALQLREAVGVPERIALSHHSLGSALSRVGRREEARFHLEAALEIERKLDLKPEIAATLSSLAMLYADLGDGEKGVETAREGIQISEEVGMLGRKLGNLDALAWAQEAAGDMVGALETARDARRLAEEIKTDASRSELAALQSKLEAREARSTIDTLEEQSRIQELRLHHQTLLRNSLIVCLVLVIAVAALGWNSYRVRRRAHREMLEAHQRIRRLEGLLPICAGCKSIRDDADVWHSLETYLSENSDVMLSHGLCPSCADKMLRDNRDDSEPPAET